MNSMTQPITIKRIPLAPGTAATRIGLSIELGLDIDLVLGAEYDIPSTLTDLERREALLLAFTEEYTRREALRDMVAAGFADTGHAAAYLEVMAGVLDDVEDEDNRRGYEQDELLVRGWAA
ncbi:hypothetical protein [Streptomyces sp. NPDC093109]|uniref:hypothetical protein n=1 Tax=Streptomyces sp. NPDC093109 TaxID=3154977 RepID=UPI00344BFBEB